MAWPCVSDNKEARSEAAAGPASAVQDGCADADYYGARTGQRQYCALVITTRLIRELQNDLGVGRKVRQLYSMKELIIRKPQSDVRKI